MLVSHPEVNEQTEASNRIIFCGLETGMYNAKGRWVDELRNVLWAYRTTPRMATKGTPFSLLYGLEILMPLDGSNRKNKKLWQNN